MRGSASVDSAIKEIKVSKYLSSKTVWGLIAIAVPYLDQVYQYANTLPEGVLPKNAQLVVGGLGWLLALYGRKVATGPLK